MRYLAAALVVIALLAASLAGDVGWFADAGDGRAWDIAATIGLLWFGWLVTTRRADHA